MTECIAFIKVKDLQATIDWYKLIGFECVATNLIWEPDCELNWAKLDYDNAGFMIGPDERDMIPDEKDVHLWFNVDSIDAMIERLTYLGISIDLEPATFYGRRNVSFKDLNGFTVSFSCKLETA
jgi:uncharacterized glyoxalase superfamily protein PhnB